MSKLSFLKSRKLKDSVPSLKCNDKKRWSSETDLEKLPPLSPAMPVSPRLSSKGMHKHRPPTPSPNRSLNNDISRLIPLSPSNSSQRLSLNLDLITLKEEILAFEGRQGQERVYPNNSISDSPRLRVRSLPSSPRTSRHRFRRPNSESDNGLKDDRIVEWIQNVQKCDNMDENDDVLDGTISDFSEFDLSGSPVLPPIQEHTTPNSHTNST